MYELKKKILER